MSQAAIDYTNAVKYVDEYFSIEYKVIDDTGEAMDRAVQLFRDYTSIKDLKVDFSLLGLLVDVAGLILPHIKVVQTSLKFLDKKAMSVVNYTLWDANDQAKAKALVGKAYEKSEEALRGKVKEFIAGVEESDATSLTLFAAKNQEQAGKIGRMMTEFHTLRASFMGILVEELQKEPANAGKLLGMMQQILGPKPAYKEAEISTFQSKFEENLYKSYYQKKAYILTTITDHGFGQKTSSTTVEGITNAVKERLKQLTFMPDVSFAVMTWNLRRQTKNERAFYASPKYGL